MPQSLDDVPDRLILFDGVCVLCCWWVRFVIERDASARFRFVAIQSTRGSALATRLAVDVASPETNVAIINGHAYFKSDAMILVLAGLPGWSWSRIFLLLPRRVRDWAYDRIARNRYRLFGRNESCLVPTSALAARFVLGGPFGGAAVTGPILVVGGRHQKGSAIPAVLHLAQLQSPIYQWVLTGLPGSTLLALGVLREGPTFTALRFLSRGTDRRYGAGGEEWQLRRCI